MANGEAITRSEQNGSTHFGGRPVQPSPGRSGPSTVPACRDYRLRQEFITPYTPEQNGIVERFFRSLKEECVWQHNFRNFAEARAAVARWIDWYNRERPHQALGYLSPHQFRAQQLQRVA